MSQQRRGRPQKPFIAADGTPIVGLRKIGPARWMVNATRQTFTEGDERKAIIRFNQLVGTNVPKVKFFNATPTKYADPTDPSSPMIVMPIHGVNVDEDKLYEWMRDRILNHAELSAQKTGIKALAWLDLVEEPKSYDLEEVLKFYTENKSAGDQRKANVESYFRRFMRMTGCRWTTDVTVQKCQKYENELRALSCKASSLRVEALAITSVLRFFGRKNGLDLSKVLAPFGVMDMPTGTVANPQPLSRDEVHAILEKVKDDKQVRLAVLLGINCLFYPIDVVQLKWKDIHGDYIQLNRSKTLVARVCVLWKETQEALEDVRKNCPVGDYVMTGPRGPYHKSTLRTRLRKLLNDSTVQFNRFRDSGYSAAANAQVDPMRLEWVAGHATGMADKYVTRSPESTRVVAEAIHKWLFE